MTLAAVYTYFVNSPTISGKYGNALGKTGGDGGHRRQCARKKTATAVWFLLVASSPTIDNCTKIKKKYHGHSSKYHSDRILERQQQFRPYCVCV